MITFPLIERMPQEKSSEERAVMVEALRRVLIEAPEVVFAYLFGSFQEGRPFRDVDIGVYLTEDADPWETAFRLAAALERALRAAGHPAPVDVRVLNEAPVAFRYHVYQGEVLVSRDEDLRARETVYAFTRYLDIKPLLEQALKEAIVSWA